MWQQVKHFKHFFVLKAEKKTHLGNRLYLSRGSYVMCANLLL